LKPDFAVIEGGKDRPAVKMWECHVCQSTTAIKLRRMPAVKSGKVGGGHDFWFCANCFANGKLTPVA
jgi:hypothetical protein